jgi:hypothetical protein
MMDLRRKKMKETDGTQFQYLITEKLIKNILMQFVDTETGISIIREQFFDTYLRGKVNIEPYIGQIYAVNG